MRKDCIRGDCGRPAKTRGLCFRHYALAQGMVNRGESTWEKLEELHLVLPVRTEEQRKAHNVKYMKFVYRKDKPKDESVAAPKEEEEARRKDKT